MAKRIRALEGVVMYSSFWKGRKVFITGHTGFKGSWLSLWLQSLGAELSGYALQPPSSPNLFELAKVDRGMHSIQGDIRDAERLQKAMQRAEPEIVIHMAAQPLVRYSYNSPVETFQVNVLGTVHVLESVRHCPSVRTAVCVTSDKCYENREWCWGYRETEALGGHDPYSSSKACAELAAAAYRKSFFEAAGHGGPSVAIATVRAGNVIGGGDWAQDRLIPDIMRAFLEKREVVLRNPEAVRPWQHVLDPLYGYMCLAEKLWEADQEFDGAWNFGPGDEQSRSVAWIVDSLAAFWGDGASWKIVQDHSLHESSQLRLDCSKARHDLHWRARLPLSQALDWTVAWYRAFQQGKDMQAFSRQQINSFEELSPSDFS